MRTLRGHLAAATVLMMLAGACSAGPAASNEQDLPTPPDPESAPPPVTADFEYQPVDLETAVGQLQDPSTAVNGVMGILDALGIGVYTSGGTQILEGSEAGPDDLWVMAELLPGLATAAFRPGPSMEEHLYSLDRLLGSGLEPVELAAAYAVMVESLPEFGMSRTIKALDIGFDPNVQLSRFEAWILLLALVPPNGTDISTSGGAGPVLAMAAPLALAQTRCGPTEKGKKKPDYSLYDQFGKPAVDAVGDEVVGKAITLLGDSWPAAGAIADRANTALGALGAFLKPLNALKDIAKAAQVAFNFDVDFSYDKNSTHEVHTTEGETAEKNQVELSVTVKFLGATADYEAQCRFVDLLDLPNPNTPIEGAQVEFLLDENLAAHGFQRRKHGYDTQNQISNRASTDANGQVIIWYQPKDEEKAAQKLGDAFLQKVQGTVTVSVNITAAMGQLFNVFSGWEFVLDLLGLNEIDAEITVGWHDPAAKIAITEPLDGWDGNMALYLETCDGSSWSGAMVVNGTLTEAGGKLHIVSDSDIAVTMAAGSSSGTSPIVLDSTMSGTVEGGTITNEMTQPGDLSLSISENGQASIEMDLGAGSQSILIETPQGNVTRGDTIKPETKAWTTTVQPHQCGDQ